jgi:hypothetical protein
MPLLGLALILAVPTSLMVCLKWPFIRIVLALYGVTAIHTMVLAYIQYGLEWFSPVNVIAWTLTIGTLYIWPLMVPLIFILRHAQSPKTPRPRPLW